MKLQNSPIQTAGAKLLNSYLIDPRRLRRELVIWIQQYFSLNGNNETPAVVGISGGADSSVVAALCVEALDKNRVVGVYMPNTSYEDQPYVEALIHHLDLQKHMTWPIDTHINALYEKMRGFNDQFAQDVLPLNSVVTGNVPARMRTNILYLVANSIGGRVVNTSNRSEIFTGYFTKWGDAVGDFGPLRNLTKTEVVAVGHALGLPVNLVERPPEDGLSGKTDEENFGFTYHDLDTYLLSGNYFDMPAESFNKIKIMWNTSQHKRDAIPAYDINTFSANDKR